MPGLDACFAQLGGNIRYKSSNWNSIRSRHQGDLVSSTQILCLSHLHNWSYCYSDLLTVELGPTLGKQAFCNAYLKAWSGNTVGYFYTVTNWEHDHQFHDRNFSQEGT